MKNLSEYITEAGFKPVKKVQPKTTKELQEIIKDTIELQGNKANLNFIDTSLITDISHLFDNLNNDINFNGDISKWDVSNVTNMSYMFKKSKFNGDISKWDVSNVTDMSYMFESSEFNQDISKWNVSNVTDMSYMFSSSKFNGDISKWDVSNVKNMNSMFASSKFNQDIHKWDVSNVNIMVSMFSSSEFNGDISNWDVSNLINADFMFRDAKKFNQDLSNWENHRPKISVRNMFKHCYIKDDYLPFGYVKGDDVIYN